MVYIDKLTTYPDSLVKNLPSNTWCHLWADDVNELHEFAKKLGMKRSWFQNKPSFPHYDLVTKRRNVAVKLGAQQVSLKEFLKERLKKKCLNTLL